MSESIEDKRHPAWSPHPAIRKHAATVQALAQRAHETIAQRNEDRRVKLEALRTATDSNQPIEEAGK